MSFRAQREILLGLSNTFLLKKINRKDINVIESTNI